MIEDKRKRTCLDFEIPRNLKTLALLLLIIVTPWIYDGLKIVVCYIIELEYRFVTFFIDQVSELFAVIKVIL